MVISKEQSLHISSSVVVSWITIGAFLWLVAEPLLVNSVSAALAEDISQTVSAEVAPINHAFIALLQRDINSCKKEIAALKFRQQHLVNGEWTSADAEHLAEKIIELEALVEAKQALVSRN